jgi:hypothetical protein
MRRGEVIAVARLHQLPAAIAYFFDFDFILLDRRRVKFFLHLRCGKDERQFPPGTGRFSVHNRPDTAQGEHVKISLERYGQRPEPIGMRSMKADGRFWIRMSRPAFTRFERLDSSAS